LSVQSRPFGVALLIAGYDQHGPQLSVFSLSLLPISFSLEADRTDCSNDRYHADPSGTFMRYHAKAIGSGSEGAQSELQDSYTKVRVYLPSLTPSILPSISPSFCNS